MDAKPPHIERPRAVEELAPGYELVHREGGERIRKLTPEDLDRAIPFFDGSPMTIRDIRASDVVKMNAFIAYSGTDEDMWEFWEYQAKLRLSYFDAPGPAMTGIPVPRLGHPDLLLEIEALAVAPSGDGQGPG